MACTQFAAGPWYVTRQSATHRSPCLVNIFQEEEGGTRSLRKVECCHQFPHNNNTVAKSSTNIHQIRRMPFGSRMLSYTGSLSTPDESRPASMRLRY